MERLEELWRELRYRVRDLTEERPWLKWAAPSIAVLALTFVVLQLARGGGGDRVLSGDRLATQVQVRFEDTGNTISVPVGYVTNDLLKLGSAPNDGSLVTNPKSGKRSGVVVEKSEWARIVADVTKLVSAGNGTP